MSKKNIVPAVELLFNKWLDVSHREFVNAYLVNMYSHIMLMFGTIDPFKVNTVLDFKTDDMLDMIIDSRRCQDAVHRISLIHAIDEKIKERYESIYDVFNFLSLRKYDGYSYCENIKISCLPIHIQNQFWTDIVFNGNIYADGIRVCCYVDKSRNSKKDIIMCINEPGIVGEDRIEKLLKRHGIFELGMIACDLETL